jgi:molecular chaperone GrpE
MSRKDQANAQQHEDPQDHVDPATQEAAEKAVEDALRAAGADHLTEPEDGTDDPTADGAAGKESGAADEIARLKAENEELKDRLMRVVADTENTKRRAEKEASDAKKYAAANFAKEMLPAVDNLRRAVESVPESLREENETVKNLAIGVEMTEKQILDAFEKGGVRKVDPVGEKFSYDRHQAISEVTDTDQPSGTIVQVLQPGYMLHDRLLRPAMVIVAKGAPKAAGEAKPDKGEDGVDTTA